MKQFIKEGTAKEINEYMHDNPSLFLASITKVGVKGEETESKREFVYAACIRRMSEEHTRGAVELAAVGHE